MNFRISSPVYTHTHTQNPQTDKKKVRIFIRIALELWVDVGRIGLFTILTLLVHKHSVTFHLFKSSSNPSVIVRSVAQHRGLEYLFVLLLGLDFLKCYHE